MEEGSAERVLLRAASWRVRRARARGPGSMGGWGEGCGSEGGGSCVEVGGEGSVVAVGISWRG